MLRKRNPYRELERRLGYRFKHRGLLEMALTHRSYRFETGGVMVDNQRLEFLGDAVLGFLAADYLYRRFDDQAEGHLTAYEQITLPPGEMVGPYCLPCQLVAARAAALLRDEKPCAKQDPEQDVST